MPRKGKGTQPIQDIPSPGYGQGEELAELQRQMPAPQARPAAEPTMFTEPVAADPIELARQYVNPTGLPPNALTENPEIPVTHGLRQGPGAGPEVLNTRPPRRHQPAADVLEQLAAVTGDPTLAARAARIRGV